MARIRTIKPDFFTSADIVGLSPLARILYIATWCEADKEGRMVWRPRTFKLRYLPGDDCDVEALCDELVKAGLVVLYGDDLAYIPTFKTHQHLNPRESASTLQDPSEPPPKKPTRASRKPDASPRVDDASARVDDAQGGREGKGKEGNTQAANASCGDVEPKNSARPTKKAPPSFSLTPELCDWCAKNFPGIDPSAEFERLRDHTFSTARSDWAGTFRNWMRKAAESRPQSSRKASATVIEPDWRREQRERNEAFLGPYAAKRSAAAPVPMEFIDAATRLVD